MAENLRDDDDFRDLVAERLLSSGLIVGRTEFDGAIDRLAEAETAITVLEDGVVDPDPDPTVVAPTAPGNFANLVLTQGIAVEDLPTAGKFTEGGGTLRFSLEGAPAGMTINEATGVVSVDAQSLPLISTASPRIVVVRAANEVGSASLAFEVAVKAPVFQINVENEGTSFYFDAPDWTGSFGVEIIREGVSEGTFYETTSGVALHSDIVDKNGVEQVPVFVVNAKLRLHEDVDASGGPTVGDRAVFDLPVAISKIAPTFLCHLYVGDQIHMEVAPGVPFDIPAGALDSGIHVEVRAQNTVGISARSKSNYLPIAATPEPDGIEVSPLATLKLADATLVASVQNGPLDSLRWTVANVPPCALVIGYTQNGDAATNVESFKVNGIEALIPEVGGEIATVNNIAVTRAQFRKLDVPGGTVTIQAKFSVVDKFNQELGLQLWSVIGEHHVKDVAMKYESSNAPYDVNAAVATAEGGAVLALFANIGNPPNEFAGATKIANIRALQRIPTSDSAAHTVAVRNATQNSSRLVIGLLSLAPGAPE